MVVFLGKIISWDISDLRKFCWKAHAWEVSIHINSILACQVWRKREKQTECQRLLCAERSSLCTYAVAAAKATTAPVVDSPGQKALVGLDTEEREQPAFRPPPTPPPWSKHFSSHHMRVLCTSCFAGNREIRNAKCSDCYRVEREEYKKRREAVQR